MFLRDVLAGPCFFYFGKERQEIEGTLAEVFAVTNVVVMVVQDKGDIKFMADREEVMDGPALLWGLVGGDSTTKNNSGREGGTCDIVVFQNQSGFDVVRE